ncbi:MAG: nucleotidyltransferase domain-containing protein [Candidatus Caldarchaeum sp.]|nr:nucleotidyltransferase domain-containing protein [Candidatus Caldarchaeum sp.]MDW8359146.1 nucleotidyltransferase domain-containing protein [Candidatus Caldarchaeum sp.]
MFRLRRVDVERRQEVFERLKVYVERVVEALQPDVVMLFGSFAADDVNEGSDVDLVVVASFKESFLDRVKILLEMNRESLPLEPVGYTADEFVEMAEKGNRFVWEVVEKGKTLYATVYGEALLEQVRKLIR